MTIKSLYPNIGCAKLNKRKINYIRKAKIKGQSYKQIGRDLKITVSTVKELWIHWLNYGEPIEIKRSGRNMLNIDENIEKIILSVHNEQKLGAVRLEKIIESKHGIHIPHKRSYEKSSFVCTCMTMQV